MKLAKQTFLAVLIVFSLSVIWLGIFPHEASRILLNQRGAVRSMSDVSLAERNYAARHPQAGYACNLGDLGDQGLVDRVLGSGTKSSYRFEIRCLQDRNQQVTNYTVTGVPVRLGAAGKYAFCSSQSGEIWYSENGVAADCLAMHKPIPQGYKDAFVCGDGHIETFKSFLESKGIECAVLKRGIGLTDYDKQFAEKIKQYISEHPELFVGKG